MIKRTKIEKSQKGGYMLHVVNATTLGIDETQFVNILHQLDEWFLDDIICKLYLNNNKVIKEEWQYPFSVAPNFLKRFLQKTKDKLVKIEPNAQKWNIVFLLGQYMHTQSTLKNIELVTPKDFDKGLLIQQFEYKEVGKLGDMTLILP